MTSKKDNPVVMLVAAEASSSLFATRLLKYWKTHKPELECFGVGNQAMEDLGFERLGKAEEMAVVGIAEIISHYGDIKAVFNRLIEEAEKRRPDVVVLMDYPEFNMMLAKRLQAMGLKVVYYIPPQIWAWRQGRVKKIKKYFNEVFVLFPFELDFYKKHDVPAQFLGHPLLDEMDDSLLDEEKQKLFRRRCGFAPDDVIVGLMPGSRRMEIALNLDTQIEVARELHRQNPHVRIMVLCAPTLTKEYLSDRLGNLKIPYKLIQDESFKMISQVDYMLVASGTATLQVALMHKPMVIMYKFKPLTYIIGKMLVDTSKFFGLANLISGKEVVPERLQHDANVGELSRLMSLYIHEPAYRQQVIEDLKQVRTKLGNRGATERVAQELEKYFVK